MTDDSRVETTADCDCRLLNLGSSVSFWSHLVLGERLCADGAETVEHVYVQCPSDDLSALRECFERGVNVLYDNPDNALLQYFVGRQSHYLYCSVDTAASRFAFP